MVACSRMASPTSCKFLSSALCLIGSTIFYFSECDPHTNDVMSREQTENLLRSDWLVSFERDVLETGKYRDYGTGI